MNFKQRGEESPQLSHSSATPFDVLTAAHMQISRDQTTLIQPKRYAGRTVEEMSISLQPMKNEMNDFFTNKSAFILIPNISSST